MHSAHQWHFFRSGGFAQISLRHGEDLRALTELDPKLWAALSCPAQGLEFDADTLRALDRDGDGRIRVPDVQAAVAWACHRLVDADVLLQGDRLPLAALNTDHEDGRRLRAAAHKLLGDAGRASESSISLSDVETGIRALATRFNGDGVITPSLTNDLDLQAVIKDVITLVGSTPDRGAEPGINAELLTRSIECSQAVLLWQKQWTEAAAASAWCENAETALAVFKSVQEKVDDYFARCAVLAFAPESATRFSQDDTQWQALLQQTLDASVKAMRDWPLARARQPVVLDFSQDLNPSWRAEIQLLKEQLMQPLHGSSASLSLAQWQQIAQQMQALLQLDASRPLQAMTALSDAQRERLLQPKIQGAIQELITQDLAVAVEVAALDELVHLLRLQKHLRVLLNNFVSFTDFYTRRDKAIFQCGELFIDGRSAELCLRVNDAAKHSALAGLSGCYLVYCDCQRRAGAETMSIVAAFTGGSTGNLMVGRNGVFFDRQNGDWDATITRIVDNPVSVSEAFFTPYRRMAKLINEQAQKFASAQEKDVEQQSVTLVSSGAEKIQKPVAEKTAPAPFDVARFAGIFAAIGLAIGAIGTAIASVLTGFLALYWWQMPLALAGLMMLISGPAMLMAYFKLRQRNLAPLLDANGWAVNVRARLTIRFGAALTHQAVLPRGAQICGQDPYEEKETPWRTYLVLLMLLAALGYAWHRGWLASWLGL